MRVKDVSDRVDRLEDRLDDRLNRIEERIDSLIDSHTYHSTNHHGRKSQVKLTALVAAAASIIYGAVEMLSRFSF
ncbi:hypothetical protein LCGC14_0310800 [marine sediment metagenome]|uniref:Uncharacterized protein n=1 Tax=marine sediment metagenome TaxID=412755 RepID=A0A0F9U4T4_9ZZZZ